MSAELQKTTEQVQSLSQEVGSLEKVLIEKKKDCNIFSESSRHALVKTCIDVTEPKLKEQLPKIGSIADSLPKLSAETGVTKITTDFHGLVKKMTEALADMVKYGAEPEKVKAREMMSSLKASAKV